MRPRFGNGGNHPRTFDRLQAMQFFAKFFGTYYGQRDFTHYFFQQKQNRRHPKTGYPAVSGLSQCSCVCNP
jgi:hypothetical protein